MLEVLCQETSVRHRRLKLKASFNVKVISFLSRTNIWDVKETSLLIFLSSGMGFTVLGIEDKFNIATLNIMKCNAI